MTAGTRARVGVYVATALLLEHTVQAAERGASRT